MRGCQKRLGPGFQVQGMSLSQGTTLSQIVDLSISVLCTLIHSGFSWLSNKRLFHFHLDFSEIETGILCMQIWNFAGFYSQATNMALRIWQNALEVLNMTKQAPLLQKVLLVWWPLVFLSKIICQLVLFKFSHMLTLWQSCSYSLLHLW